MLRLTVDSIVEDCAKLAKLVSPVVCNSSPEGFLPLEEQKVSAVPFVEAQVQ